MASPFELYLVRHAIAAERSTHRAGDDTRPLTARGVVRFKKAVAGLATLGAGIDEVFTSPLVRARQTAALLAAGLRGAPAVRVLDALAPGHAPPAVVAQLARAVRRRRRRIALVGHEPGLGELAAHLIGAGRPLPFRKGGICRIDMESLTSRRPGVLAWFLPPKVLRGLGA